MLRKFFTLAMLITAIFSSLATASPAAAAPRERCFKETGYCISGSILDYWEKNGGLSVFGYPITPLQTEWNNDGWNGPTQWFERDRLEDHASDRQGILAGRLGAAYLDITGRSWQNLPKDDPNSVGTGCRYFAETGHSLCGKFLQYWSKNGGLERFGYPISKEMHEELPTWGGTVQYFERRRMEIHPENAGTQYEVLLGLLGRELNTYYTGGCGDVISSLQKTAQAFGQSFACATPLPMVGVQIATQQFERGQMVWVPGQTSTSGGTIYVVFFDNGRNRTVWQSYYDGWTEGQPVTITDPVPAGKVAPTRGFGKLWSETPSVRNTLGWAVATEVGEAGHVQSFRNGNTLIYRSSNDRVYLFYSDNTVDDVNRIK